MKRVVMFLSTVIFLFGINGNSFSLTTPTAEITIDGDFSDWEGVTPAVVDPQNDEEFGGASGADLFEFYIARDETNLYLMMSLFDGPPNPYLMYNFEIFNNPDDRSQIDGNYVTGVYTLDDRTTWVSNIFIRGGGQTLYYDNFALGPNAIEWALPLADFGLLDRPMATITIGDRGGDENVQIFDSADITETPPDTGGGDGGGGGGCFISTMNK